MHVKYLREYSHGVQESQREESVMVFAFDTSNETKTLFGVGTYLYLLDIGMYIL